MNNNITPETEFEMLLLSDRRIVSMIKKLRNMADGNFEYIIERGLLDDHFVKIIANDISMQLFMADKIYPLKLKLSEIDKFLNINEFNLFEIDKRGNYEVFESELFALLHENIDENEKLLLDAFYMNDRISKLAEKHILDCELRTKLVSCVKKSIKV